MAAALNFFTSNGTNFINNLAGSGLGFYGNGSFGASVMVLAYQDNTYITDSTGALQGPKAQNVNYLAPASGDLGSGDFRNLLAIPNQLSTLNIRFTYDTPVKTLAPSLIIYDRTDLNAPASGLVCQVSENVHPWAISTPNGSGSTQWYNLGGSGGLINGYTYDAGLPFNSPSPGSGGTATGGVNTISSVHDFYLNLSASPNSIGSKTLFGLAMSVEYL